MIMEMIGVVLRTTQIQCSNIIFIYQHLISPLVYSLASLLVGLKPNLRTCTLSRAHMVKNSLRTTTERLTKRLVASARTHTVAAAPHQGHDEDNFYSNDECDRTGSQPRLQILPQCGIFSLHDHCVFPHFVFFIASTIAPKWEFPNLSRSSPDAIGRIITPVGS